MESSYSFLARMRCNSYLSVDYVVSNYRSKIISEFSFLVSEKIALVLTQNTAITYSIVTSLLSRLYK